MRWASLVLFIQVASSVAVHDKNPQEILDAMKKEAVEMITNVGALQATLKTGTHPQTQHQGSRQQAPSPEPALEEPSGDLDSEKPKPLTQRVGSQTTQKNKQQPQSQTLPQTQTQTQTQHPSSDANKQAQKSAGKFDPVTSACSSLNAKDCLCAYYTEKDKCMVAEAKPEQAKNWDTYRFCFRCKYRKGRCFEMDNPEARWINSEDRLFLFHEGCPKPPPNEGKVKSVALLTDACSTFKDSKECNCAAFVDTTKCTLEEDPAQFNAYCRKCEWKGTCNDVPTGTQRNQLTTNPGFEEFCENNEELKKAADHVVACKQLCEEGGDVAADPKCEVSKSHCVNGKWGGAGGPPASQHKAGGSGQCKGDTETKCKKECVEDKQLLNDKPHCAACAQFCKEKDGEFVWETPQDGGQPPPTTTTTDGNQLEGSEGNDATTTGASRNPPPPPPPTPECKGAFVVPYCKYECPKKPLGKVKKCLGCQQYCKEQPDGKFKWEKPE